MNLVATHYNCTSPMDYISHHALHSHIPIHHYTNHTAVTLHSLALIVSPHLHLIHSHTFKQHSHMHSPRSLVLPRLTFWAFPLYLSRFMGFPVPSSPCLVCMRVRMCEQVSVGACDWGKFAPAESHHHWAISVPVTLSLLSDPCSLRSTFRRRFWFLVSAIPEPCCFPGLRSPETRLPIASLRYPPQPLRKLSFCLRKAPFLPTGSSASALRKAPFSFSLCILLVINSLFPQLNPPSSLWQKDLTQSSWIQRRLVVCRNC